MEDSADITAVKLENKKIYLQDSLSTTWVIIQAFSRDKVAVFISDLKGKIANIVGNMDPEKSEGTRTTEIASEDYKLISESETEVSLLEGSFGKLIRVKNENIFRASSSRDDVFEEEGFETERTDDEEGFVTILRNRYLDTGKKALDKRRETCKESEFHECVEKRAPSPIAVDLDEEVRDIGTYIHQTFFFNRKQRAVRNWKLERAVRLAMTKIAGPHLRNIRIKKRPSPEEKRAVQIVEKPIVEDNGSSVIVPEYTGICIKNNTLHDKVLVAVAQNECEEDARPEKTLYEENADRNVNKTVLEGAKDENIYDRQALDGKEEDKMRKRRIKRLYSESAYSSEREDGDMEDSTDSFEGVTIRAPKLFSVFDVLFDQESLSDEL